MEERSSSRGGWEAAIKCIRQVGITKSAKPCKRQPLNWTPHRSHKNSAASLGVDAQPNPKGERERERKRKGERERGRKRKGEREREKEWGVHQAATPRFAEKLQHFLVIKTKRNGWHWQRAKKLIVETGSRRATASGYINLHSAFACVAALRFKRKAATFWTFASQSSDP